MSIRISRLALALVVAVAAVGRRLDDHGAASLSDGLHDIDHRQGRWRFNKRRHGRLGNGLRNNFRSRFDLRFFFRLFLDERRIETRAFHNGLLLLSCGVSTLRIIPPLLVSRAEVDEALVLLETALGEALAQK